MAKLTAFERVTLYKTKDYKLEFISGKWFYNKIEIKDIIKYLACADHLQSYFSFKDVNDIKNWCDCFKYKYGEEGKWHESKIVREAKKQTEMRELAFPLTVEQLKIINVLLFRPEEEVFFICTGVGGSGKSTFGNIVRQLFDNDVSYCSLSDLANQFSFAEAVKHRLIYSSELNADELDNKGIKQLASKEPVFVNPKGEQGYNINTQSSLLFNCNKVPKIDLGDSGTLRRIIYYCRDKKIENPDLTLRDKQYTQDELVNIAYVASKINMENWRKDFEKDTHKMLMKNNSVYICRAAKDYEQYKIMCAKKGLKAFGEPNWIEIKELISDWTNTKFSKFKEIEDDEPLPF